MVKSCLLCYKGLIRPRDQLWHLIHGNNIMKGAALSNGSCEILWESEEPGVLIFISEEGTAEDMKKKSLKETLL